MAFVRKLFVTAIFVVFASPLTSALAQERVGSLTQAVGDIVVIHAAGDGVQGGVGSPVFPSDMVFVGPEGEVTITFVDNTIVALGSGTALTIDELIYDPTGQNSSASFDLAGGQMGFVSGDIVKTGNMVVTTPDSTLHIRGTAGLINSNGRNDTGGGLTLEDLEKYLRAGSTIGSLFGPGGVNGNSPGAGSASREEVTLMASPDGTIGLVLVINTITGATTTLNALGATATTNSDGTIGTKIIDAARLQAVFGKVLRALQTATGVNLGVERLSGTVDFRGIFQEFLDAIDEGEDASPS